MPTVAQSPTVPAIGRDDVGVRAPTARPIRLLVFTSLYPNREQARHGIFVEERLRHLIDAGRVTATVVAPVPWFPFRHPRFGAYAKYARVPAEEQRHGMRVLHPRYPVIPKIGMHLAPGLMRRALRPTLARLLADRAAFDLIDAHYLYPDGVAAVALARRLGVPVVVSARGNDVTLIPQSPPARRRVLDAVAHADATITVSAALRARLIELGADGARITVVRNGVDLARFRPDSAGAALRQRLVSTPRAWLTVGHLIERKGVHLVIPALAQCADVTLLIAGDGPEEHALRALAGRLGVADRVRFLGAIGHDDLPAYYGAADALMLASSREGMPNVALEALACGTPVVAAPFAGAAEVVSAPEAGEIAEARTAEGMAAGWRRLAARRPSREATRRFGETLGWGPVVAAQYAVYARVLAAHASNATGKAA